MSEENKPIHEFVFMQGMTQWIILDEIYKAFELNMERPIVITIRGVDEDATNNIGESDE